MIPASTLRSAYARRTRLWQQLGVFRDRIQQAMIDPDRVPEARQRRADDIASDATDLVTRTLGELESRADDLHATATRRVESVRDVPDEKLALRAQIFGPLIQAAGTRPEAVVEAYRRDFGDPVSRRLLEEIADTLTLTLDGEAKLRFQSLWEQASKALKAQRPQAETDALAELDQAERHRQWVSLVATYSRKQLAALGGPQMEFTVWTSPGEIERHERAELELVSA